MVNEKFYTIIQNVTLRDVCEVTGGTINGSFEDGSRVIKSVQSMDNASNADVTFFHNPKYLEQLQTIKACACLIKPELKELLPASVVAIECPEPYFSLAKLLEYFYSPKVRNQDAASYISSRASVSEEAVIGESCYIDDFVQISSGCVIGRNTFIGAGTVLRPNVEIGENSCIEPNVTIGFAIIGKKAYIKTGARIGQQGFGFHIGKNGPFDVPQVGLVMIGEDTQIGANCTIDRGSVSDTIIGSHVRIDDMVHIAHNVNIGDFSIIAGQCGISGSVKIGKGCALGGQVGIAGHLVIGDRVTIAAQSGVMQNIESGKTVGGSPATGITSWHRQTVVLRKLAKVRGNRG
ncbi:MAG: UDP-3-O-(3-hydroxymyristoyl)glucosamine N-acyltransferase [Puniceicoccales bacterium]|jgi:UDP-3-O-[3-hydroxymyristoyl] glucosamine N-acyltransferase|nr:UDP-3-O-(3-hydroxymyristoyl)glucosamine N-acyltransferase [Puniceicoccales bacterium]